MMARKILPMALCVILAACASPPVERSGARQELPPRSGPSGLSKLFDSEFTLAQMAAFVQQISKLDVAGRQTEVRRLQGKSEPGANERLKLGYLLSLENATPEDLGQAQAQLDGLDAVFADSATRLYVRQLQRTVVVEIARRQEKRRADELQDKLRQIKELELDLMKRNGLNPTQIK